MAFRYSIRLAMESDIDTLVAFTRQSALESEGQDLSAQEATEGVRGGFGPRPSATYWIAEDSSGTIVASVSIVKEWSDFHGGDNWWIQSMFVLPEHRGSGLVDRLIQHVTAEARSGGALDLRLYVHASNARAIRVYERCGFSEAPYAIMTLNRFSRLTDP